MRILIEGKRLLTIAKMYEVKEQICWRLEAFEHVARMRKEDEEDLRVDEVDFDEDWCRRQVYFASLHSL